MVMDDLLTSKVQLISHLQQGRLDDALALAKSMLSSHQGSDETVRELTE
jgi:hypothetical protein